LIGEIVVLLSTWKGEIFRSVIEKGERLYLAPDAMIAVSDWIDKMSRNEFHTRTEWDEIPFGDCTIEGSDGKTVYEGFLERIQDEMWRDMAMKALVVGDRSTLARIIAPCHAGRQEFQSAFGNDYAKIIFKVEGEKLVKLREQTEKGKVIFAEMKELWGDGPLIWVDDANFDEDNCNENGYQIRDEWYAEDLDMQRAIWVLKKLRHIK
jgi:hypothetical protein